jgi:hypothetical protein
MRFIILVKTARDSEAGVMPGEAHLAATAAYRDELAKAGALLDAAGLQPSSKGWRIQCRSGTRTIVDGPFTEAKELVAGYTLIQAKSVEEAREWSRRFPLPGDAVIEVRQLFELDEFAPSEAVDDFRRMRATTKRA